MLYTFNYHSHNCCKRLTIMTPLAYLQFAAVDNTSQIAFGTVQWYAFSFVCKSCGNSELNEQHVQSKFRKYSTQYSVFHRCTLFIWLPKTIRQLFSIPFIPLAIEIYFCLLLGHDFPLFIIVYLNFIKYDSK